MTSPKFKKISDDAMVYDGRIMKYSVLPSSVRHDRNKPGRMPASLVNRARRYMKMTEVELNEKATNEVLRLKKLRLLERLGEKRCSAKMKRDWPQYFEVTEDELKKERQQMQKLIDVLDAQDWYNSAK